MPKKAIQDIAKHNLCPLDTAVRLCQLLDDPGLSYDVIGTKKIPKDTKKAAELFCLLRDYLTQSTKREWDDITTAFLEWGFDEEVFKTAEIWRNWQKNLLSSAKHEEKSKEVASDVNTAVFFGIAHLALKNEKGWDYLKQAAQVEKEYLEKGAWNHDIFFYKAVEKTIKTFIESTKLSERNLINKEIASDFKAIHRYKFNYQNLVEIFAKHPIGSQ